MIKLTRQERRTLDVIEHWIATRGTGPSVREVARRIGQGRSHGFAARLIQGLEKRGLVRRLPRKARALEVSRAPVFLRFNDQLKELEPL